jgi:hypothetical protein
MPEQAPFIGRAKRPGRQSPRKHDTTIRAFRRKRKRPRAPVKRARGAPYTRPGHSAKTKWHRSAKGTTASTAFFSPQGSCCHTPRPWRKTAARRPKESAIHGENTRRTSPTPGRPPGLKRSPPHAKHGPERRDGNPVGHSRHFFPLVPGKALQHNHIETRAASQIFIALSHSLLSLPFLPCRTRPVSFAVFFSCSLPALQAKRGKRHPAPSPFLPS